MSRIPLCISVAAGALALGLTQPSFAETYTAYEYGGDLSKLCARDRKSAEYAMCVSFVGAVLEVATNNTIYDKKVCVPPLTTIQKAVDLTIKWLGEHPSDDIRPASAVVTDALAGAFQCRDK